MMDYITYFDVRYISEEVFIDIYYDIIHVNENRKTETGVEIIYEVEYDIFLD